MFSICLACALASGVAVAAEPLDRVVAVVNGDVVLLSELRRATERHPMLREALAQLGPQSTAEQREAKIREVRAHVLDDLVNHTLVREEAAKFQITATDADVERYLPLVASQNGLSVEDLRSQVEASGEYGTWDEYREQLREDILQFKVVQTFAQAAVSDAQVREYYRKMTRDESERIDLQRFVFAAKSEDAKARDEAFANAQAVARQLRTGADAADVAAKAGLATDDLAQTVGRGDVPPVLEDAIFAAKPGQVVGPLASGQGYAVFKVLERHASGAVSFEQAQERIRQQLEAEAFLKAEAQFKEQLRAKAHIDNRL